MDKLILNCSQCGGRLEITQEIEIFRCRFCGTPYLVERKDGTVEVKRLEARVTALESGQADIKASLAAEEEIKTLLARRQELKQLREQPRAPDYSEQLRWNATGSCSALLLLFFGMIGGYFVLVTLSAASAKLETTGCFAALAAATGLLMYLVYRWQDTSPASRATRQAIRAIDDEIATSYRREAELQAQIDKVRRPAKE